MKHNISKKYSLVLIIFLVLVTIGLTYSFFANQGIVLFNNDVSVTSNTTDLLTFQIDNDIEFEVSQTDFVSGGNNKSGYTDARAILVPNNKTGAATMNYYMYLNIEDNPIDYSSTNTNELPELMLQLYDGNNELVTIDYLDEMITVKGVTGYDITGFEGLIPLLDNQEIVATNNTQTTQEWKVVVTLINLDINQNDNTGKELIAEVIMQKDEYNPDDLTGNLAAVIDKEIKLDNSLMKEYRGEGYYHDENDRDTEHPFFTRPIYYWDGSTDTNQNEIVNKWNVVFGNSCWVIMRTTDTGGVKLLYNGEVSKSQDELGNIQYDCSSNRIANNVGIGTRESVSFNGNYYYGDYYDYDREISKYRLVNESNSTILMNSSNGNSLEGKYTCKSSNAGDTCSTLYFVDEYISGSDAYAITLGSFNISDSLGMSPFNSTDNSLGYIGYMYGDIYQYSTNSLTMVPNDFFTTLDLSGRYYAHSVYNSNTKYVFADDYTYNNGIYVLNSNAQSAANWKDTTECNNAYNCLEGKYTLIKPDVNANNSKIYYVRKVVGNLLYMVEYTLNNTLASGNTQFVLGTSVGNYQNGYYDIQNIVNVNKFDWMDEYSNYVNYYICSDGVSTHCPANELRYISSTSITGYSYYPIYLYSNKYTYSNGTYTLDMSDTNAINIPGQLDNYNPIGKAHYTCFNASGTCNEINYVYNVNSNIAYYITLTGGKYVSTDESNPTVFKSDNNAIYGMLYSDNVNRTNSTIKDKIDWWYKATLFKYTPYIDSEEIYCDDRRISDYGSWNNNSDVINTGYSSGKNISFVGSTVNLNCRLKTDSFSASETTLGNGDLKYPIGLLTASEINLIEPTSTKYIPYACGYGDYSLSNVALFSSNYTSDNHNGSGLFIVHYGKNENGCPRCGTGTIRDSNRRSLKTYNVSLSGGIRPSIALPADTLEYSQGDGSATNPYVIDAGNNIILNDINYSSTKTKAVQGEKITVTNNKYIVGSYKLNGTTIIGNTFIMPDEDVEITDIKVYKIKNNSNNDNVILPNSAIPGDNIRVGLLNNHGYTITSFKLNGVLVNGNTFTMSNENAIITDVVIEGALEALRNNLNYRIVDYIEFTGTQYIDLDIVPSNHTTEIKFDYDEYNNDEHLFGTLSNQNYYSFTAYNNNYYWGRNGNQTNAGPWTSGIHLLTYNGDNNSVVIDGNTLGSGVEISSTTSLRIGYRGNTRNLLKGKVYYYKLIDKSTNNIVRWMIPTVRLNDGEIGMYDIVNNVFYTNQGTGTFIVPS